MARHFTGSATKIAYLLLAGISTPLVVSVHSIVSFDFAVSVIPGWHTTIFPPYFVAGAVYAGFAMVLTLGIPMRAMFNLKDFITMRHIDNMAKVMLATGLFVAYGYGIEAFTSLVYAANTYENYMMTNRMFGPYGWCVLDAGPHEHSRFRNSSGSAVGGAASDAVLHLDVDQYWHVVGTVCDCGGQLAPRFRAGVVGDVLSHNMGLRLVHRHAGVLLVHDAAVCSWAPGDLYC